MRRGIAERRFPGGAGGGGFGVLFHDLIMHGAGPDAGFGRAFWVMVRGPGAMFAVGWRGSRFF